MAKASTSSERNKGCGTDSDAVFEDLEVEGQELLFELLTSSLMMMRLIINF